MAQGDDSGIFNYWCLNVRTVLRPIGFSDKLNGQQISPIRDTNGKIHRFFTCITSSLYDSSECPLCNVVLLFFVKENLYNNNNNNNNNN